MNLPIKQAQRILVIIVAILLSQAGHAFEAKLDKLIATMMGHHEGLLKTDNPLQDLSAIDLERAPAERLKRTRHILRVLGGYQFPSELTARELIANALDSYYYSAHGMSADKTATVKITAESSTGQFAVVDEGVGMDLDQIIFYLLAPMRSKNPAILDVNASVAGVTGKFGQGFFSVLSFLKTANDRVYVHTKTAVGPAYTVTLRKENSEYIVEVNSNPHKTSRGTMVLISSDSLKSDKGAAFLSSSIVPKYFRFNYRGMILVNGVSVNQRGAYRLYEREIRDWQPTPIRIYADTNSTGKVGTVALMVNGIVIDELQFSGENIYPSVAIDLPSDTELSSDRGTLNYANQTLRDFAKEVLHFAFDEDKVLFNTLYPLADEDHFNLSNIGLWSGSDMVSADATSENIVDVNGRNAVRMSPRFLEDVGISLYNILPSTVSRSKLVGVKTRFRSPATQVEFRKIRDTKIVFLRDGLDFGNRTTIPLTNLIYGLNEEKKSASSTEELFSTSALHHMAQGRKPSAAAVSVVDGEIGPAPTEFSESLTKHIWEAEKEFYLEYGPLILDFIYHLAYKLDFPPADSIEKLQLMWALGEFVQRGIAANKKYLQSLTQPRKDLYALIEPIKEAALVFLRIHENNKTVTYSLKEKFIEFLSLEDFATGRSTAVAKKFGTYFEEVVNQISDSDNAGYANIFVSEDDLDFRLQLLALCEKNKLNRCAQIVHFKSDELRKTEQTQNETQLLKHMSYLSQSDVEQNKFNQRWFDYLTQNILTLDDNTLEISRESIGLVEKFYNRFCDNPKYPRKEIGVKRCLELLPSLQHEVLVDFSLMTYLKIFIGNENFYANNESAEECLEVLINYFDGHLVFSYLYPVVIGEQIDFYPLKKDYDESLLGRNISVVQHPKIQEVLGVDASGIEKEFTAAVFTQNFTPYTWMRETLKNAAEAQSPDFHVTVSKNSDAGLVVTLRDHGVGIAADKMHYLYIPKYTSKENDPEDINMGWGLFTVFKEFDEAIVESSTDGVTKSSVRLVKNDRAMLISENSPTVEDPSFVRGTKITLVRHSRPARLIEPLLLKGNLMRFAMASTELEIFFNDEPVKTFNSAELLREELTGPVVVNGVNKITLHSHPSGGVFYRGREQSFTLNKYLTALPTLWQENIKKLPVRLAANFIGSFKQNSGRTAFLDEDTFKDGLSRAVQEALLAQMAQTLATQPKLFSSLLPYDYFEEFRIARDGHAQVNEIVARVGGSAEPLSSLLTNDREIGSYLLSLPTMTGGDSIDSIKHRIKNILIARGVVNEHGKYIHGAKFESGVLADELRMSTLLKPLIDHFEIAIVAKIHSTKAQSNHVGQTLDDKFVEALPSSYDDKKPGLIKLMKLMSTVAERILHKRVEVLFYDQADSSTAHSNQGQSAEPLQRFAFNLASSSVRSFLEMLDKKEWDHLLFLQMVSTMAHELVHCSERDGEITHDRAFFDKQIELLQNAFAITDADIDEWSTQLWQ